MEHSRLARLWHRLQCYCYFPSAVWLAALFLLTYGPAIAQAPVNDFVIKSFISSNYPDGSYPGKCLTFGRARGPQGPPVVIRDCDGSSWQRFVVEDLPVPAPHGGVTHKAVLHAGNACVGTLSGVIALGTPLVVRNCSDALVLKLDGDSLIVDSNHIYVAEVKDGHPANGTPVVLGFRQLSDIEFWTFSAADHTARKPTAAFVEVTNWDSFMHALQNASPGTVIEVSWPQIQIGDHRTWTPNSDCGGSGFIQIPAGVTVRGDRRGTLFGPLIWLDTGQNAESLFEISGDDVRITGLRLQGPSRDKDGSPPAMRGICSQSHSGVVVDHSDISDWPAAAVDLRDAHAESACKQLQFQLDVIVARNFIHDNQNKSGGGYGVAAGSGAAPAILGNTFLRNRHAVTGDNSTFTSYNAEFNLVLSDVPYYGFHKVEQDFDVHGNGPNHTGGFGATNVNIARNTFFGTNRANIALRGASCLPATTRVQDNVFQRKQSDNEAILWYGAGCDYRGDPLCGSGTAPAWLALNGNQFGKDPTQKLGVGDFDGDGKDDLFLATGAAWYYSARGATEWRFLSAKTETLDTLLFGDFDNDGRTDVFTQIGDDWMVSWGGISPWEKINSSKWRMRDFVIGDFVGDRRADVFFARGDQWFVSDAGRGPFVPYAASSFKKPDLAFGHFDGLKKFGNDEKTDVAGVVNNQWMAVYAQTDHVWKPFRPGPAPTKTMKGMIVADFDGDGSSDLALAFPLIGWRVSYGGEGPWLPLSPALGSGPFVAVGRFDDNKGADILVWDSRSLAIVPAGTGARHPWSRQDMK